MVHETNSNITSSTVLPIKDLLYSEYLIVFGHSTIYLINPANSLEYGRLIITNKSFITCLVSAFTPPQVFGKLLCSFSQSAGVLFSTKRIMSNTCLSEASYICSSKQGSATRTLRCKLLEGCWRHASRSCCTWLLNAWLCHIRLCSWLLCSRIRLSCSCC